MNQNVTINKKYTLKYITLRPKININISKYMFCISIIKQNDT